MTPPKPSAVILRAQSDQRLVALARSGSEAAFEALVRRHRHELVTHCRRLLLSEGRAEDAVQQALLSAWQALHAGDEVQHPRAWLHRIAHNRALDARKRSGYDHVELQASLQGGVLPQEEIERRTVVRETLAGLARLPELQRDVLLRTAVHGDSYDQVAHDLALPESTVRGMLHRARGTLRAAATAVTPGPLVAWAAAAQPAAPAVHGMAEGLTVGGSAGLAGLGAKLAAVTVVAGGVVGGLAGQQMGHRPATSSATHGGSTQAHRSAPRRAAAAAPAAGVAVAVPHPTPVALVTPRRTAAVVHHATGKGTSSRQQHGASTGAPGSGSGSGSGSDDREQGRPTDEPARPAGDDGGSDATKPAHEGDQSPSSDEPAVSKPVQRESSGEDGGSSHGGDRSEASSPTTTAPAADGTAPSGDGGSSPEGDSSRGSGDDKQHAADDG
ncbi:MAG: hypothetical protein QOH43_2534 [Solirubrobacteraceae bacterium]|jgi:RNA polymerase sigma factor (sigma-70 family)|nr:hypothetical protein [Solirubrobacteraceae bacterium]